MKIPQYKLELVHEKDVIVDDLVGNDNIAAKIIIEAIGMSAVEKVVVVFLDGGSNMLGITIIASGSTNCVSFNLSEVFRAALIAGAQGIIFGHNHPYDDCCPSKEDWQCAINIMDMSNKLNITFVDSIIVSPSGRYESLRDISDRDSVYKGKLW